MQTTFYPSADDYKPMDGTYESEFKRNLYCFDYRYRAIICNDSDLRATLMEDNYRTKVMFLINNKK
jgi:hypothetical protein